MPIEVTCNCGKVLRARDEQAGGQAKCPACRLVVSIPLLADVLPQNVAPTSASESATSPRGGTKQCPFCGEEILTTARKCKHCGEWFDSVTSRAGSPVEDRGSADARAISRGLKEKDFQDTTVGCGGVVAIIAAVGAGFWVLSAIGSSILGWIVGIVIFLVIVVPLSNWYWKE